MKKIVFLFVVIIIANILAAILMAIQGRFGIFIALTIIFPFVILAFVFSLLRKQRQNVNNLLKNGEQAKASILNVSETGVIINGKPQIALQLEVTPKSAPPFNVKIHELVSVFRPVNYQQGMIVQVRYDTNNLKSVVIESSSEDFTSKTQSENASLTHNLDVKPLLCPSCGGQIAMNENLYKEKFIMCNYCGTVINLHE